MNLNPTSSPTTGISTISTLPDEILQLIVDDLDNLSTCQLSITCRRLHFFALQIFFERNGLGSLGEGVFFVLESSQGGDSSCEGRFVRSKPIRHRLLLQRGFISAFFGLYQLATPDIPCLSNQARYIAF